MEASKLQWLDESPRIPGYTMSLPVMDERIQPTTDLEGYINFDLSIHVRRDYGRIGIEDVQNSTSCQDIIGVALQVLQDLSADPERRIWLWLWSGPVPTSAAACVLASEEHDGRPLLGLKFSEGSQTRH